MTDSVKYARTLMLAIGIVATNFSIHAESLQDHVGKNRVIITFSSTQSNPQRFSLIKHIDQFQCEFKARDLIHIDLIQGSDDYESLGKQFSLSGTQFKLLLLGKDGEVKLKTTNPSLVEVFSTIDAMPMRKREMQDPSANGQFDECVSSSITKN